MMRRGMVCTGTAFALCVAALASLTVTAALASSRSHALDARAERIQAREWCLGASALQPGAEIMVGHWRVERHRDGSTSASGPDGLYAIDRHGQERWAARAGSAR